jgi:uncharacterized membrane protein
VAPSTGSVAKWNDWARKHESVIDIVVIGFLAVAILVAVFADGQFDDKSTLAIRVVVVAVCVVAASVWPRARAYAGLLAVVLVLAVAVASAIYALSAEPVTVSNDPTTADFAIEACRLQSTSVIEPNQGVTVIFILPAPGDSAKSAAAMTLAVSGTAMSQIPIREQSCKRGEGGALATIRVKRGDASATAQDFARGLEAAPAVHVLPGAKP